MKTKQSQIWELKKIIQLKDEEIKRQIKAKKLAQQTRNWILIVVAVFEVVRLFF